jgi:hypothetical protein
MNDIKSVLRQISAKLLKIKVFTNKINKIIKIKEIIYFGQLYKKINNRKIINKIKSLIEGVNKISNLAKSKSLKYFCFKILLPQQILFSRIDQIVN